MLRRSRPALTRSRRIVSPVVAGPRINLGSWAHAPASWINVEGSWNAWLSQRPRLRRLAEAARILPEWASETQWPPNIVVPNLRTVVTEYLGERPFADSEQKAGELSAADRMNERLGLRDRRPPAGNVAY